MYRVDHPTGSIALAAPTAPTATPNRYYFGGNESLGQPATIVEAEHLNMITEELCNAVIASGQSLNKSLRNQLTTAVTNLATSAIPTPLPLARGGTNATSLSTAPNFSGGGFNLLRTDGTTVSASPRFGIWSSDILGGFVAGNATTDLAMMGLQRARGTVAAPTPVQALDTLGAFGFWGYPAHASGIHCCGISAYAAQTHAAGATGAMLSFFVTPNNTSGALVDAMDITPDSRVNFYGVVYTARWFAWTPYDNPAGGLWSNSVGNTGAQIGGGAMMMWDGPGGGIMQLTADGNLWIAGPTAQKASGTTWANPSDIRLKKDIEPYSRGLAEVLRLDPISYRFNGQGGLPDDGTRHIGLDANATEPVMPEMVSPRASDAMLMLDASALIYALVNAVKELHAKIEEHQTHG